MEEVFNEAHLFFFVSDQYVYRSLKNQFTRVFELIAFFMWAEQSTSTISLKACHRSRQLFSVTWINTVNDYIG